MSLPDTENALVSIVIPAYKPTWFEAALASACSQTYAHLEIVICDDSADERIAAVVQRVQDTSTACIRYQRNPQALGELHNTVKCIQQARGHYLKFLHDDDVLDPDSVALLVRAIEAAPGIAMASSRRRRIDEHGQPLADILATTFPFAEDVRIDGKALVSHLVDDTLNFIGEPSCVLCRRSDVLAFGDQLMSLNGRLIHWVGDLSVYAKLLQLGDLAFVARPLTDFRVSTEQFSQLGRDQPGIGQQGHEDFRQQVRALGWYQDLGGAVPVSPLRHPEAVQAVDLSQCLHHAYQTQINRQEQRHWYASRVPSPVQTKLIEQRLASFQGGPLIAVVVLDPLSQAEALTRTLKSLEAARRQYGALRVFVLSTASQWGETDPQVQYTCLAAADFTAQINRIGGQSGCRWLMLLDAGDCLTASGLPLIGLELLDDPQCRAIYADAMLAQDDTPSPALRPGFNLDYLLSRPGLMARNWLYNCQALDEAGGFDPRFAPHLEFELILRMINQQGLVGFGHVSEPLVINQLAVPDDSTLLCEAVCGHLQARGYLQASVTSPRPGHLKIDYGHQHLPQVSIVVVLDEDVPALQRCLISLLEHTRYPHYDLVVVDHGCTDPAAQPWLDATQQLLGARLQVVSADRSTGRAGALNLGAQQATGEYLLLLRGDTVFMQDRWLDELLNHGQRPEVGIVGAKTISTARKVTHAGIVLGLENSAGHAFVGQAMHSPGYLDRLLVDQNYSAVSDVCLLIRKDVFDAVEGLDSDAFDQGGADIDLCLRVAHQGYLTVWTPHAALVHDTPTPAVPEALREAFVRRWGPQLPRDPAYNSSLSLTDSGGFKLADAQLSWRPLAWKPLPVILARAGDVHGCGHYRVIQPLDALKASGRADGALVYRVPEPMHLERYAPDTLVLQRPVGEQSLAALQRVHAFSQVFKVYELDDYLPNVPVRSVHRARMPKDITRSLRKGLSYVDRFVVSTDVLAHELRDFHPHIQVVRNRLDPGWWGNLPLSQRRTAARARVGWAGGSGHTGDLELIAGVVEALADEVDWVFFGMCPERLRPFVKEFHPGVRIDLYPAALARLNLDLALAPLEDNLFNACKSNLRLLEYGICGVPVVCSDLVCYRGDLPVTTVRNRFRDWVEAIRMHLNDLDAAALAGDTLREAVKRDWMLDERALGEWQRAWLAD
ncbi:hypothetical protein PS910_00513 [Pseudomonas fluorescens]|nr:hypothetical protein PS910_00513 [Pseudomonas fluorescens]